MKINFSLIENYIFLEFIETIAISNKKRKREI